MKAQRAVSLLAFALLISIAAQSHAVPISVGGSNVGQLPFTYASRGTGAPPLGEFDPTLSGKVLYENTINIVVPIYTKPDNQPRGEGSITMIDRVVRNNAGTLDFYSIVFGGSYYGPHFTRTNTTPILDAVDMGIRSDQEPVYVSDFIFDRSQKSVERSNDGKTFLFFNLAQFERNSGVVYYRTLATSFDLGASGSVLAYYGPHDEGKATVTGLAQPIFEPVVGIPEPSSVILVVLGLALVFPAIGRNVKLKQSNYKIHHG